MALLAALQVGSTRVQRDPREAKVVGFGVPGPGLGSVQLILAPQVVGTWERCKGGQ